MDSQKTIAAISTPLGNGAISIIRCSGDDSLKIASTLFRTSKLSTFADATPNMAYYGTFTAPNVNDKCIAIYFKAPHSYTGEDMVEFQCHGGMRLTNEVFKAMLDAGCSPATKGEFTKRSFLNGKVSLADAEGIIDMINAESLASLKAGYRLMNGEIARTIDNLQDNILDLVSGLEASLDYPDEMEDETKEEGNVVLRELDAKLDKLLSTADKGKYIKDGIDVAIIGVPNIGKSSLLNALLKTDRAIVTDIAGTTRDTLEEKFEVDGIILNLIDTAGIRTETSDKIEEIGVKKAESVAKNADLVLFLLDASRDINEDERQLLSTYSDKKILKVYNKSDMGISPNIEKDGNIFISAKTGDGVDKLTRHIVKMFLDESIDSTGNVITSVRHLDAIKRAKESIELCIQSIDYAPIECTLIDLRNAYTALGEVTGKTASEDIIDRVFSRFCLGK